MLIVMTKKNIKKLLIFEEFYVFLLVLVLLVMGLTAWTEKCYALEQAAQGLQKPIADEKQELTDEITESPIGPWTANQVIQPEELTKVLSDPKAEKPLVIHVGPPKQYRLSHIPGAKHLELGLVTLGVAATLKEAQSLPLDKEIVIYCGCCALEDCPSIRPAFQVTRNLGLTKVKVLNLKHNFFLDWVRKGFPVEKGDK